MNKLDKATSGNRYAASVLASVSVSFVSVVSGAMVTFAGQREAKALEPLETYLVAASKANLDNREELHKELQSEEQASVATAGYLPTFNAYGRYTQNQYDVSLNFGGVPFTIAPRNQWDALITLNVPVIDVVAWIKAHSASLASDAEKLNQAATRLAVERQVVIAYYQYAGALALVPSTNSSLAAAQENLRIAQAQRAAGAAAEVDVQQALAEVASDQQVVANAELQRELGRRQLTTLSGLGPTGDDPPTGALDDAREEAPLADWQGRATTTPAMAAAQTEAEAQDSAAKAGKYAFLPTLSATGQEHFTNATAFALGHSVYYAIFGTLNWNLDFSLAPRLRAQNEASEIAKVQEERARIQTGDDIHQAWWTVHADIAQSKAAVARATAARLAADLAKDRYAKGVGTQLEAIQALRDATNADVVKIQADASLAAARSVLRLATGQSLMDTPEATRPQGVAPSSGAPAPSSAPSAAPSASFGATLGTSPAATATSTPPAPAPAAALAPVSAPMMPSTAAPGPTPIAPRAPSANPPSTARTPPSSSNPPMPTAPTTPVVPARP